jgi:D-alanyl-D-alanine carboxypeptidase
LKALLAAALAALAAFGAFAQPVTPPPIAARAYYLLDVQSGQALAAAAENDRFEPASLTKMMTAYLVFAALRDRKLDEAREVIVSTRGRARDRCAHVRDSGPAGDDRRPCARADRAIRQRRGDRARGGGRGRRGEPSSRR